MIEENPNILLIISDCTRPDKLSCYGYKKNITPNMDKIAEEGTLFKNAYTQGVWTLPTHASLFTGLYPSEHGLLSASDELDIQLDQDYTTLAEFLKEKGYVTASISNNPWVGQLSSMDRGFDFFMESDGEIRDNLGLEYNVPLSISTIQRVQSTVGGFLFKLIIPYLVKRSVFTKFSLELAEKVMKYAKRRNKRFFIFMNLMDTHQPYYPPRTLLNKFGEKNYLKFSSVLDNYKMKKYFDGKRSDKKVKTILNDYYDASLRYQDKEIGELVKKMRNESLLDKTILFITSDHGKNLGEYNTGQQTNYLSDEILKIPLIVRFPELFSKSKVEDEVQLIDIHYTIKRIISGKKTSEKSLVDVMGEKKRYPSFFEAELPYNVLGSEDLSETKKYTGVIKNGKKLIESNDKYYEVKGKNENNLKMRRINNQNESEIKRLLEQYKKDYQGYKKEKEQYERAKINKTIEQLDI